jgi:hypothetical protein
MRSLRVKGWQDVWIGEDVQTLGECAIMLHYSTLSVLFLSTVVLRGSRFAINIEFSFQYVQSDILRNWPTSDHIVLTTFKTLSIRSEVVKLRKVLHKGRNKIFSLLSCYVT